METIKEALTFDDVTLAPNYSEILPSEVNTSINLTESLKLNRVSHKTMRGKLSVFTSHFLALHLEII